MIRHGKMDPDDQRDIEVADMVIESDHRERPIIFSAAMVCAILNDRKTKTRRVVKPQPFEMHQCAGQIRACWSEREMPCYQPIYCPFGEPGDRLWVRETWTCKMDSGEFVYRPDGHHECLYRATEEFNVTKDDGDGGTEYRRDGTEASPWRPSIFMPRWASRITLEITGTRVERLQDITETDAIAEGIEGRYHPDDPNLWTWKDYGTSEWSPTPRFHYGSLVTPVSTYEGLWDSINGKKHRWKSNPWV